MSTWFALQLPVLVSDCLSPLYLLAFIYYAYLKFLASLLSNLASGCMCFSTCHLSFLVLVLFCYLIILVFKILMGKQRWKYAEET